MTKRAILAGAFVLLSVVGLVRPADAVTAKRALVYGDSITWDALPAMYAHAGLWGLINKSVPGQSPCDWLPHLTSDLATYTPAVVTLETAVDDQTCNVLPRGSAALYAAYAADITTFITTAQAVGAKVLLVAAPPMKNAAWNADITAVMSIEAQLAATYGATFVTAPRTAVSGVGGVYTDTKACLLSERTNPQCIAGQIFVRTQPPAIDAGIHFCPDGLHYPTTPCDEYDSGGRRYGRAVDTAIKNA